MQTVEINWDMGFEEKFFLRLYWTARKSSRTEGCAPFYIRKITTTNNKYIQKTPKILKLSPKLISNIQKDIRNFKRLEVEINQGKEELHVNFRDGDFSISSSKNKELEVEIAGEISEQFKKKHPRTCPHFLHRIYKQD